MTDLSDIKPGEIHELPSTINWLQLWKHLTLDLKQSQLWLLGCQGRDSVVQLIAKNWPRNDLEGMSKGKFCHFTINDNDLRLAMSSIFLEVMTNKREWLIIKNTARFMDDNRPVIQKIAKDLNLKVLLLCK